MTLEDAAVVAQVLAAGSAVVLARQRRDHTPAAVALVLLAAASVLKIPVLAGLRPLPRPVEGAGRALIYIDGALSLSFNAVVAGLPVALAVSPERRRRAAWIVVAVWFAASVMLGTLYPSPLVRGAGLQRVYLAADLIGLFVATVALITWARAGIAAKQSPALRHLVAIGLATFDALILLAPYSPWRADVFGASFFGPQMAITAFFAVVTVVQVVAWKR